MFGASRVATPLQNHLLAALPLKDFSRLLPELEPVPLPLGWTVHGVGDREKYLYFLTEGIVSRLYMTENGASTVFALTGSEGVIGLASFLGGASMPTQAMVLGAGYAYRLAANLLDIELQHGGPLLQGRWRMRRRLSGNHPNDAQHQLLGSTGDLSLGGSCQRSSGATSAPEHEARHSNTAEEIVLVINTRDSVVPGRSDAGFHCPGSKPLRIPVNTPAL